MQDALWLVPLLPLAGSAIVLATRGELPDRSVGFIGVGSVGLAAVVALAIAARFLGGAEGFRASRASLGNWLTSGSFSVRFGLHLDALSLVMMLVITVVGFLIHLYSTAYMDGDEGYSRFFAYMN